MERRKRPEQDEPRKTVKPLSKHRLNRAGWMQGDGIVIGFAFALAALFIAIAVLSPKPEGSLTWLGIGVLILAILAFPGLLVWWSLGYPTEVHVYPYGLWWRCRGQEYEYAWQDVQKVYRVEAASANQKRRVGELKLIFKDGERVRFFHRLLTEYDRLADLVQRLTAEQLLPAARADLEESAAVFGPVKVSQEGFTAGEEFVRWEKVKGFEVIRGMLACRMGKRYLHVKLGTIPNYLVLFLLLGELGKASR